jgi:hypothetical protein
VHLTRKLRALQAGRIVRLRNFGGRDVIVAPILGKDRKVHRFIVLDKNDPLPVVREESATYLRAN